MKEIKNSHFTLDGRGLKNTTWFLIDTDETLKTKIKHRVCISLHMQTVNYIGGEEYNIKYLVGRDDLLPKPCIADYIKASNTLKKNKMRYNKKKGIIVKVKP